MSHLTFVVMGFFYASDWFSFWLFVFGFRSTMAEKLKSAGRIADLISHVCKYLMFLIWSPQRLLPIDGANDLFFQPPPSMPTSKIYSIRPYLSKDESAVYKICREIYTEGCDGIPFSEQEPDLIGDRLVGGLLTQSPDYGFVLEDEEGICGYALGTVDVKPFVKKCKMSWIPFMQEKYNKPDSEKDLSEAEKMMLSFHEEDEGLPDSFLGNFPSLIKVDIHAKVTDPSVAKSIMGCLLSSLKANGSHGAFCEVRQVDKQMLDFYGKLGCFEVAKMEGFPKDIIIMGRSL